MVRVSWEVCEGCGESPQAGNRITNSPSMESHHLQPTPILDYAAPAVRDFTQSIVSTDESALGFLRAAHARISQAITPIYTIRELQPVSQTIQKRQGSCSQRLACLEAVPRCAGIGTRVRGLWVAGQFWKRRFPITTGFIPDRILLAWPQFAVEHEWLGVEEIVGRLDDLAVTSNSGFGNDGETLFEAVQFTAIDFEGRTRACGAGCDLSRFVVESCGLFDSRDDLFREMGTLESTWRGRVFEFFYAGRKSA